jgi:hypothetical protein
VTRDHAPRYQGRFERYTGTFTLYFPSHHKLEREFFKKSWGNWKLLLRVWTTALPIEGDDGLAHCPGPTAPFTRPWHCPRQIGPVGRFCMGAERRFTAQKSGFPARADHPDNFAVRQFSMLYQVRARPATGARVGDHTRVTLGRVAPHRAGTAVLCEGSAQCSVLHQPIDEIRDYFGDEVRWVRRAGFDLVNLEGTLF